MYKFNKSANKKVKNATVCRADGIEFKSKLEMFCYLWFKSEGLTLSYESECVLIHEGFLTDDRVSVWLPRKSRSDGKRHMSKTKSFLGMTYTPDFTYTAGEDVFYIETKGNPNDAYPLRRKLLVAALEKASVELDCRFHFFEPHTKAEVQETCEIIKSIINNGKED